MKSNSRLTKQGIPDLNYYGPRPKSLVPVEETPATASLEEVASPVDAAAKVGETPRDTDVPPS